MSLNNNKRFNEMDDLIRREDALNCFHSWIDTYGDLCSADEMEEYQAIEALPTVDVPHWIPVTERLPNEGEYVLVTEKWYGYVWMWRLKYIDDEPTWEINGYNVDIDEAVAWMPLPNGYKEEK